MLILIIGKLAHFCQQKFSERLFPQSTVVKTELAVIKVVVQTPKTYRTKLVQIRRRDGQKFKSVENTSLTMFCLIQHTVIELQPA
jgi:hypothetical protein